MILILCKLDVTVVFLRWAWYYLIGQSFLQPVKQRRCQSVLGWRIVTRWVALSITLCQRHDDSRTTIHPDFLVKLELEALGLYPDHYVDTYKVTFKDYSGPSPVVNWLAGPQCMTIILNRQEQDTLSPVSGISVRRGPRWKDLFIQSSGV